MKYRYLSILLLFLILSIGAVSAQDDAAAEDNIAIVQDGEVLSALEFVIDDSNYDNYDEIHKFSKNTIPKNDRRMNKILNNSNHNTQFKSINSFSAQLSL